MGIAEELFWSGIVLIAGGLCVFALFLLKVAQRLFKNRRVQKTYTDRLVGVDVKTNQWVIKRVLDDDYIERVLE